jgi:hypothetical protein
VSFSVSMVVGVKSVASLFVQPARMGILVKQPVRTSSDDAGGRKLPSTVGR